MCTFAASAQFPSKAFPQSNLRSKKIRVQADSIVLDSFSIIPKTFSIYETDTSFYQVDLVKAVLYWKLKPPKDSVTVLYRVFPYKWNAVVQRLSYDSVINNVFRSPYEFAPENAESKNVFDFGTVQYNGSFGQST